MPSGWTDGRYPRATSPPRNASAVAASITG